MTVIVIVAAFFDGPFLISLSKSYQLLPYLFITFRNSLGQVLNPLKNSKATSEKKPVKIPVGRNQ